MAIAYSEFMPRGFKKDVIETELRQFKDKRSFVGFKPGDTKPHDLLFGIDKSERRLEIFDHFGGICTVCQKYAPQNVGTWHHVKNAAWERCDCIHNAEWRHWNKCHAPEHPTPQLRWIPK